MNIEKAVLAINEWYEGERFAVVGIVDEPINDRTQVFNQSDHFLEVVGWQGGDESGYGPSHHGDVYFLLDSGKWVKTEFF